MAKNWNQEDAALIEAEVRRPTMSNQELAKKLNRSLQSISAKKRHVAALLAEQEGFTCVLYHTDENTLRAGWVSSANLTWYYPGRTEYLGRSTGNNGTYYGDAEASWSRDYFVGTRQKYTYLQKTYYNCNQFTLDYQVTARNGVDTQACLGPRTVYVNDGSGWVAVGTFSYNDLGPVNVVITLDQPMTIMAVATSASCSKPDTFSFRQSVLDIYCN